MKRKIIAISGNIAAGKSEIAEILAKSLNMEVYSASQSYRALARQYGMSLVEFNQYVKDKPEFDKQVESKTAEVAKSRENLIIDARLGWYVVPEAFKVSVKSKIEVASKRLNKFCVSRGQEERYDTIEEAKQAIILRERAERERYSRQYQIDLDDDKNYDLIIDSSDMEPEDVAKKIAAKYIEWLAK